MNFTLLTILLCLWICWYIYKEFFIAKWKRQRRLIKAELKRINLIFLEEATTLTNKQQEEIQLQLDSFHKRYKNHKKSSVYFGSLEYDLKKFMKNSTLTNSKNFWRQNIRSFVITIIVILIIRNFFLMPFVIPTGSMQPTLNGINYYYAGEKYGNEIFAPSQPPNKLNRILEGLFYGRSYVNTPFINPQDYFIRPSNLFEITTNLLGIPILQNFVTLEDERGDKIFFPGIQDTLQKALYITYKQKKQTIRGVVEVGDFLLVNRWSYYFSSPKRGDIVVFSTKSLSYENQKLRGAFYVKRLIGIGGDTVKIDKNNQTWIKPKGEKKFIKLHKINPNLTKLFSHKGGYKGHSTLTPIRDALEKTTLYIKGKNRRAFILGNEVFLYDKMKEIYVPSQETKKWQDYYLKTSYSKGKIFLIGKKDRFIFRKNDKKSYTFYSYKNKNNYKMTINNQYSYYYIPKGFYFTLGDNTNSSLDSRYWGVVPQKELVGKPLIIFWPFNKNWGIADKNKVLDFATP